MENNIDSLREQLFDTIEKVKDGTLDTAKAKIIMNLSQTVINSAKAEIDFLKAMGGCGEVTGFIPWRGFQQTPIEK